MSTIFRTRQGAVVSELIDGESVIMHLRTGRYYSARGTAASVWALLEAGVPISEVAERHARAANASPAQVAADIEQMVTMATAELLGDVQPYVEPSAPVEVPMPAVWSTPVLEVFSDLEELLLLDPIHDVVEEQGWPLQRPPE